jgi:hypothetical protein
MSTAKFCGRNAYAALRWGPAPSNYDQRLRAIFRRFLMWIAAALSKFLKSSSKALTSLYFAMQHLLIKFA